MPWELVNSVMMSPQPPWAADHPPENSIGDAGHGREYGRGPDVDVAYFKTASEVVREH